MTERQRFNLGEMKERLCELQEYRCGAPGCDRSITADQCELAHRIPQDVVNLRRFGKAIIHHRQNLAAVCLGSHRCNAAVSIRGDARAITELVRRIESLQQGGGH